MNVLATGAHPDEIELECDMALLAHPRRGNQVNQLAMTTGGEGAAEILGAGFEAAFFRRAERARGGAEAVELIQEAFADVDVCRLPVSAPGPHLPPARRSKGSRISTWRS